MMISRLSIECKFMESWFHHEKWIVADLRNFRHFFIKYKFLINFFKNNIKF